jgi:hypothetical protein
LRPYARPLSFRARRAAWFGALCAVALGFGCSGGGGCGGCGSPLTKPIKSPFANGIQIRVTDSGFNFVEQNLRPILDQFLPNGLKFCLPGQCGGYSVHIPWPFDTDLELIRYAVCHNANGDTCGQATPYRDGICTNGCQISLNLADVDIRPQNATDTLQIYLRFDQISTALHVALNSDIVNPQGACQLRLTSNSFPVTADLQLRIDPQTRRLTFGSNLNTQIDLANLDLNASVSGNLRICDPFDFGLCTPSVCGLVDGLVSTLINNGTIRNLILSALQGPISSAVNSFADSIRCVQCGGGNPPCRPGSSCQSGKCVFTSGASAGQCVPTPLGMETEVNAGAFVQGFSPSTQAVLRFAAHAGGFVDVVQNGVSTGMITGVDTDESTCVPDTEPPSARDVPRATILDGNTIPCAAGDTACAANPTPYKAGVAVSQQLLNHLFYSIYRSGLLCLNVSSELTDFLSTANFALFLPSLARLTGGKNAPMFLGVRPTEAPTVELGQGRLRRDASGNLVLENGMPVLEEALITLRIPNLKLVFHALIDDRYVKLFDIMVDAVIPLAVYFRADGSMAPVVGNLQQALTNVRVSPSAILKEEPDALGAVIDIALQQALPFLAGAIENAAVQIPSVQRFELVLDDRRIKMFENGSPSHKFIGLFSELRYMPARMMRGSFNADARLAGLEVPPASSYAARAAGSVAGRRLPRAAATIEARVTGTIAADAVEWQWRLDRGPWSLFTPSRRFVVESPLLLLQGEHTVEVRARHKEDQTFLSEPAPVRFKVDTVNPTLRIDRDGDVLRFVGSDPGTPAERLQYSTRIDQGSWSAFSADRALRIDTLAPGPHELHVRVRDEAGNEALATRVFATHGRTSGGSQPGCGGSGCGATGSNAAGGLAWLALVAAALLLARRRVFGARASLRGRSHLLTMFFVIGAVLALGACSDNRGGSVPPTARCVVDTDCPEGERCFVDTGVCVPVGGCKTDADCGPGQYCAADLDGDGRRDCAFRRCTSNAECADQVTCTGAQVPTCRDGACACELPCGGACPEGKFCCGASNACQDVPVACVLACSMGTQCASFGAHAACVSGQCGCAPGYRLDVQAEGRLDDKTCVIVGSSCACVESAPLPLGDIGRWSHATMAGSTLWVSAYNSTYGDLVAGRYDAQAGTFTWFDVDGVPSGAAVTGAPSGPRGGVAETGDDVGTDTRIAAAADGTLHIAYHDVTNGKLKYARGTPTSGDRIAFVAHTVDTEGQNGRYTSLVLDAMGRPAIAYMTMSVDVGGARKSRARLARARNATPAGQGDWDKVTLHEVALPAVPCGGACPSGRVCARSGNTFACAETTAGCSPACAMGEACVAGACVEVNRASTLVGLPEGTGLFNALALGPDGRLWNAFYDRLRGNLVLVAVNGTTASAPQILDGENARGGDTGDVGQWVALAIGPDGKRQLAYVNTTTDELWHMVVDDQGATARVIDTGLRTAGGEPIGPNNPTPQSGAVVAEEHLVGDDVKLVLEEGGALRVAYMDSTQIDLLHGKLNPATGQYALETLAGNEVPYAGAFGFHVSIVKDGARYRVVNYKFDLKNDTSGLDVRFLP